MAERKNIYDKKPKPESFPFTTNEIINKIKNHDGNKSSLEWLQILKDFDIQQYQIFIQKNILNDKSKISKWTKDTQKAIRCNVTNYSKIKSFLEILRDINIKKYNIQIDQLISSAIKENLNNKKDKLSKSFKIINEDLYYQYLGAIELANNVDSQKDITGLKNNVKYNNDNCVIQNQKQ